MNTTETNSNSLGERYYDYCLAQRIRESSPKQAELPFFNQVIEEKENQRWSFSKVLTSFKFLEDNARRLFNEYGAIPGDRLTKLFENSDDMIVKNLTPFMSKYFNVGSGANSNTELHECGHVVILPVRAQSSHREPIFQLHSLRMLVTPDHVETECLPLPLIFRNHSAARLLERTEGYTAGIRQVAIELVSWLPLVALAEENAIANYDSSLLMPACYKAGALVGKYRMDYPLIEGRRTVTKASKTQRENIPRDPLEGYVFEASTFLGESEQELVENREPSINLLKRWKSQNQADFDRLQSDLLWPNRHLSPSSGDCYEALSESLIELLDNLEVCHVVHQSTFKSKRLRDQVLDDSMNENAKICGR